MDLRLGGKTVLVTGGSKGIGFATAKAFADEGSRVILVSRDHATLKAAAAKISTPGGAEMITHAADLSNEAQRERMAALYDLVDVLVNNAGAIPRGELDDLSVDAWRTGWDLKVFGYVHLTKLFLAQMRARGAGVILNVIGTAGRAPRADYVCGASANASLVAFTEAVGGHSPDFGVRVLGVNPGYTATERFLGRPIGDEPDPADLRREYPGARVALPSAVAELIVFLCSDRARCLSGVVVDCDQGQLRSGPTRPTPSTGLDS